MSDMSTGQNDTRSYTEIATGTRVRTLVARRAHKRTGDFSLVDIPAGTIGTVRFCTHAGFNGRVHQIRTDDGLLVSGLSANEVEIVASPANARWSPSTPDRCRR